MRKLLLALLAVGSMAAISTATTTPAEAWGGCGPHRHPTAFGCRWNGYYAGPALVAPGYGWHRRWGWHRPYGWHRHYW